MAEVSPLAVRVTIMLALAFAIACVAGRSAPRRVAVVALSLLSLAVPLSLPADQTLARGLFALWTILLVLRAVDLARERRPSPWHLRVALMYVVFDARAVTREAPLVHVPTLLGALSFAALAAFGLAGALVWIPQPVTPLGWSLRLFCGAVFVYASADAAGRWTMFSTKALGLRIPPQHDNPVLSRSVAEFWSKRWNINVSSWLMRHAFRPFAARRMPVLGLVAAFVASALLHWWLIFAALGWFWSVPMGGFFLLQGALVVAEKKLGLHRLATSWQRVWTVGWMLLTAPLFVEPFLRLIHSPSSSL